MFKILSSQVETKMTHKSLHSLKKNSHKTFNILINSNIIVKKKFTFFSYL